MRITVLILCGMVVFLSSQIVKTENQLYAMESGLCRQWQPEIPGSIQAEAECLETAQTRTFWAWHLFYNFQR